MRWLVWVGAVMALAGCERAERSAASQDALALDQPRARVQWISRDLSQAIGERTYLDLIDSLEAEKKLNTEADVRQRVQSIASRLVRQAVALYPFSQSWAWDLHVIEDDDINASCMPGGKMTINSGLLQGAVFDDHKIATVLGHEIAHALLEHGRSSIGRGAFTGSALYVMAQSFKMGRIRLATLVESMDTVVLPLEREQEREADRLGMELMARAGFNPVRGAAIWRDMMGDDTPTTLARRLESYASSHPAGAERLDSLSRLAERLAGTPGKRP